MPLLAVALQEEDGVGMFTSAVRDWAEGAALDGEEDGSGVNWKGKNNNT